MNLFNFLKKFQKRSSSLSTSLETALKNSNILAGPSRAGVDVTKESVLGLSVALRCIEIISNSIATLPLQIFENQKGQQVKINDIKNSFIRVLNKKPNNMMTKPVFWKAILANILIHGNAYAAIKWDNKGELEQLILLDSLRMVPIIVKNNTTGEQKLRYRYNNIVFLDSEILHFKSLSFDGLVGLSPLEVSKEVFGGAIAIERHGHTVFKNGANIVGILKHPKTLGPGIAEGLRGQWEELYSGSDNAGKTAILEEGMEFQKISMSLVDLDFLNQRSFDALQICNIYGIPSHMVNSMEKATFNNMEQKFEEFRQLTILPLAINLEEEINQKLFFGAESYENYYCKFNFNGFARALQEARYKSYQTGITAGFLTRNEVREWEELDKLEGLDDIIVPLNMGTIDEFKKESSNNSDLEEDKKDVKDRELNLTIPPMERYFTVFQEILERANTKLKNSKQDLEKKSSVVVEMLFNTSLLLPTITEQNLRSNLSKFSQDFIKRDFENPVSAMEIKKLLECIYEKNS